MTAQQQKYPDRPNPYTLGLSKEVLLLIDRPAKVRTALKLKGYPMDLVYEAEKNWKRKKTMGVWNRTSVSFIVEYVFSGFVKPKEPEPLVVRNQVRSGQNWYDKKKELEARGVTNAGELARYYTDDEIKLHLPA